MKRLKVTIKPLTAFGREILGETLFGQICWQIRFAVGNDRLESLLKTYTQGDPFLVVSDAFPHGFLPIPEMPSYFWDHEGSAKELKKRSWISTEYLNEPLRNWKKKGEHFSPLRVHTQVQSHNTINRLTSTTGTGQFAPFVCSNEFYENSALLDFYLLLREDVETELILQSIQSIGLTGYGRDASVGLGKFEVKDIEEVHWMTDESLDPGTRKHSYITLASADFSGLTFFSPTFYRTKTHFGRFGSVRAVYGNPFKKPLLLAKRGAVVTIETKEPIQWIGRGISEVSNNQEACVHQGYAILYDLGNIDFVE